jgi:hypothetical protein
MPVNGRPDTAGPVPMGQKKVGFTSAVGSAKGHFRVTYSFLYFFQIVISMSKLFDKFSPRQ